MIVVVLSLVLPMCSEDYLDIYPEDKITSAIFWKTGSDFELALNGIYAVLREQYVYGFGAGRDGSSPNAHQWNGPDMAVANGSLTTSTAGIVTGRWTSCYRMISRANYLLANIQNDDVELTEDAKKIYIGEASFLRGVAYALIADTYGGGPVITSVISTGEAREISRASVEQTWAQAIADYDVAIQNLGVTAPKTGRATKGSALGMKMRAYLYQGKYEEVLDMCDQIDQLGKYSLFSSYAGLFRLENENNQEVLFDVQYIVGDQGQGDRWQQDYFPPTVGLASKGYVAPTQNLVDEYEMIDGSPVNPANPYEGRDPRLDFTIVRPGAYWSGALFPTEAMNHNGQRVGFSLRKYSIENQTFPPFQGPLNFMILRYADVLLSKAEALIETNQTDEGISLLNRVRTERDDVKMYSIPLGLSKEQARERYRKERRIELAMEGLYWDDFRRWNLGFDVYPLQIIAKDGGIVETRFPSGYHERYRYLPIPDAERSLNPNLEQNTGW